MITTYGEQKTKVAFLGAPISFWPTVSVSVPFYLQIVEKYGLVFAKLSHTANKGSDGLYQDIVYSSI